MAEEKLVIYLYWPNRDVQFLGLRAVQYKLMFTMNRKVAPDTVLGMASSWYCGTSIYIMNRS